MATTTKPAGAISLTVDPARWNDRLVDWFHEQYGHGVSRAEREIAATMSAILGDNRPFVLHHNSEGMWCVRIDGTTANTIEVHWSSYTPRYNASHGRNWLDNITRGEAVMVLIHETGHLLYTDEIQRPDWCDKRVWTTFFAVVNFAEDVRIEDALENEVPAFPFLRRTENDRLVAPNIAAWDKHDPVHRLAMYLFSERSCTNGSDELAHLPTEDERQMLDAARPAFMAACDAATTAGCVENLHGVYDAFAPMFDALLQQPPVPSPTGDPDGGDGDPQGGDADGTTPDAGQDGTPGTSGDVDGDEDGDGDGTSGGDGDTDEDAEDTDEDEDAGGGSNTDEDAEDTDEDEDGDGDGDTDEDGERSNDAPDATGGGNGANLSTGGADVSERARPDRSRGKWDEDKSEATPKPDNIDKIMKGETIVSRRQTRRRSYTEDANAVQRLLPITRMVAKSLRRVLQDNANGGWISRRRAGAFDPAAAKRLAIGDLRTFRKRSGPKGSLDYSLVVCMDSSGSVGGHVGMAISDAGMAIYEAARKIDGLDVALCTYGSTVEYAIPFDSMLDKRHVKKRAKIDERMYRSIRGGANGGTSEASALMWARSVSKRRKADAQMIVVLTDGEPNEQADVVEQIRWASYEGIVTGGIGVGYDAPEYHTYSTSIMDVQQLPSVLGAFVRTMMKGGK